MTQAAQDLAFQKDYLERYEAAKEYSKRLTAPSLVERFVALPEASRVRILGQLSKVELAALMYAWESWARAKQHPKLDDNIRVLLFLGGRGGGKTVAGAQFIRESVYAGSRSLALLGPTEGEIEQYMLGVEEDDEGLLNIFPPTQRPEYIANDGIVRFHTGAVGYITSAEKPELRGPNFDTAWADEVMKWRFLVPLWDNLEFATRKSFVSRTRPGHFVRPRICVTTTPRPRRWLKERVVDRETLTLFLKTDENPHNDETWRKRQHRLHGGTRQGAEQLEGEILEDSGDALFLSRIIDETRVSSAPKLARTVISVDPARSDGPKSDTTGVNVAGADLADHIYVLADLTATTGTTVWKSIIDAYVAHDAEAIVVENNGAFLLVDGNLRAAMERKRGGIAAEALKIVSVFAKTSQTKYDRAGPVSGLHKRERLHMVGHAMPELEAEMTEWNPKLGKKSPNRLDALVWAVWYLGNLAGDEEIDPHEGFRGLAEVTKELQKPSGKSTVAGRTITSALGRDPWGTKI